jgi:hypothetical protein
VVVGAPTALRRDPLFAEDTTHRAIDGWAAVLAGDEPDPEDVAALHRAVVDSRASGLEAACALAALAARTDLASHLELRAARALTTRLPTDLGSRAALLAALAPAAGVPFEDSSATDLVTRTITELREDGWRALATERDRPSVMARLAAALLLADRSDAFGRALYERARERAADGQGFAPDVADAYVGTLALALAARQIGDDAFADALAPGLVQRAHLAPRLGPEAVFWAYATSAYGALGASSPSHVTLEIDGARSEIALVDGVATIAAAPGRTVHVVADDLVWARAESRVLRDATTADDVPVSARIDGTSGRLGERAAIELSVESTADAEQSGLVVELTLPSSAAFDDETRRAVLAAPAVTAIDGPDGAGVVRVHLAPLRGRGAHHVPLPVRWRASGRVRGLATVVYAEGSPWSRTSRPAITLDVEAP